MVIYLGADHRGFNLKDPVKKYVKELGYEVADMGAAAYDEGDDYPEFAKLVAEKVGPSGGSDRGVLICGSGAGMDIVANKFHGVRSTLAVSPDQVYAARHDDDVNILVLEADFMEESQVLQSVKVFLATPFGGEERYKRRLKEIGDIEEQQKSSY